MKIGPTGPVGKIIPDHMLQKKSKKREKSLFGEAKGTTRQELRARNLSISKNHEEC